MTPVHGLLVLDKPGGMTSREALDRAAKWFPRKTKAGHCGTLDPLATGVLVLALGHATRLVEYVQAMPKTYRTRITLGATSDTDDADGTVTPTGAGSVDAAVVLAALPAFVGEVEQTPPAYSAARVDGKRVHELARKGKRSRWPRGVYGSTASTSGRSRGPISNWTWLAARGPTSARSPATWEKSSASAVTWRSCGD